MCFDDDAAGARVAWLRRHLTSLGRIPVAGVGLTVQRLRALADLGAADGSLARLAEGHLDALAILDELGADAGPTDALRGVWAARPEQLRARPDGTRLAAQRAQAVVLRRCRRSTGRS